MSLTFSPPPSDKAELEGDGAFTPKFDRDGLITAVVTDARDGELLMVAHMNDEALALTLRTGDMHYTSRRRGLWRKGETSGNVQRVVSLSADCDGDAVLATVVPAGPACHLNTITCFGDGRVDPLHALDATIQARAVSPQEGSYTSRLLGDRNLRLKKLGEEAAELVTACADGDRVRAVEETVQRRGVLRSHRCCRARRPRADRAAPP